MEKDEFSSFLEKAYKQGRVKNLEEAFINYPPEEEWHEGKIEKVKK